jgi:hypothetical protein
VLDFFILRQSLVVWKNTIVKGGRVGKMGAIKARNTEMHIHKSELMMMMYQHPAITPKSTAILFSQSS